MSFFLLTYSTGLMGEAFGAIIGTNQSAEPLTEARIAALPSDQQSAWREYLRRSIQQRQSDQEFLRKEIRTHRVEQLLMPASASSRSWAPLTYPDAWYAGSEAQQIADGIVSFQTPAGGWSKNIDMSKARAPGMLFALSSSVKSLGPVDFDRAVRGWNYVGTFDNEATILQLRFLARVIPVADSSHRNRYHHAFQRGLEFIFASQYPNGGWPQVWPLSGGYHDAVTFNDDAMLNVLSLLREVAFVSNRFAFVSAADRQKAASAYARGLDCLLASQVAVDKRLTVWPQQGDVLTLKPTAARNYEMPSLASSESARILSFLMEIPEPSFEMVNPIHAGVAWFQKTQIRDMAYPSGGTNRRVLSSTPGEGPIWARFYDVETDRPLFGDRDKTIHDSIDEISDERRAGYSWFNNAGENVLKKFSRWSRQHPK